MSSHKPLNSLKLLFIVAGALYLSATAVGQNLRDLAREQSTRNPGTPLEQPAPPAEIWPKPVEDIARGADVILQGRLTRIGSRLSPSSDIILTDYSIVQPVVIAGNVPVTPTRLPGEVVPLIVTVDGGEVQLDGVTVRTTDYSRAPISEAAPYLLFLKQSAGSEAGHYSIYHGGIFDISQGDVRPLLKSAKDVYQGGIDRRVDDFTARIRKAKAR